MAYVRVTERILKTLGNEFVYVETWEDSDNTVNCCVLRENKKLKEFSFPEFVSKEPLQVAIAYSKTLFNSYITVIFKRGDEIKSVEVKDSKFDPVTCAMPSQTVMKYIL